MMNCPMEIHRDEKELLSYPPMFEHCSICHCLLVGVFRPGFLLLIQIAQRPYGFPHHVDALGGVIPVALFSRVVLILINREGSQ